MAKAKKAPKKKAAKKAPKKKATKKKATKKAAPKKKAKSPKPGGRKTAPRKQQSGGTWPKPVRSKKAAARRSLAKAPQARPAAPVVPAPEPIVWPEVKESAYEALVGLVGR